MCSSTTVRFKLGVLKRNERSKTILPSPVKHLPRMETLPEQTSAANARVLGDSPNNNRFKSREDYARVTKRLQSHMRYYCTAWSGKTFESAYHTVVDEEGCAGRVDGLQKRGILSVPIALITKRSAEFPAVKLLPP